MSVVRLSINENNARTILPANPENNNTLNFFHVIFKPSTESPQGTFREFPVKGNLQKVLDTPYPVPEGCYERVEILAFTTNYWDNDYLGAIGKSEKFEIKSTVADPVIEIALNTLADNPDIKITHGYFSWDIDNSKNNLDYSTVGDTAKMTITPLTGGTAEDTVYFLVKGFNSNIKLNTGIYNVSFEFGRKDCSFVKFSEILYIATGGAVSKYPYTIPPLASTKVSVTYRPNHPNAADIYWDTVVGSLIPILPISSPHPDRTQVFKGWYKDAALTKQWNFNYDRVLSNPTILYAKWAEELKEILPGTFTMGSPVSEGGNGNDRPQHQVTLTKGFYMSKYQVTQEHYQTVMGTNPSQFTGNPAVGEIQGRRPVERVSWYDAIVFCNKLSILEELSPVYTISGSTDPDIWITANGGNVPTSSNSAWNAVTMDRSKNGYRLPTEAEWEYACRAGTTTAYNTGSTFINDTGWYAGNSGMITHEVGKKPANAWGLYDMHGNVYDKCWDWIGAYTTGSVTDPTGPTSPTLGEYRVSRGGDFGMDNTNEHRSAWRTAHSPWGKTNYIGFRVVRSL